MTLRKQANMPFILSKSQTPPVVNCTMTDVKIYKPYIENMTWPYILGIVPLHTNSPQIVTQAQLKIRKKKPVASDGDTVTSTPVPFFMDAKPIPRPISLFERRQPTITRHRGVGEENLKGRNERSASRIQKPN